MKKKNSDVAIELIDVSKQYIIHHEKPTLVGRFVKRRDEEFFAIRKVSIVIRREEKVGIIGPNGSGKTTLLKIIAGITSPTSGYVKTHGTVVSLIDLEAGFHPDLTGDQNIYLNGMILGMSKRQIDDVFDDIVRFADIKQFIDAPLFTYSTGMKLRLGFSIAVHSNPDILILDEGFMVGDEYFQNKVIGKINEFFRAKKTMLMVTQWVDFLKKNSRRLIKIERGVIMSDRTLFLSKQ